jgi:hypothetical protein
VNLDQAEGDDGKSYFVITDFLAVSGGFALCCDLSTSYSTDHSCDLSTSYISYACVSQICAYCSMRICISLVPSPKSQSVISLVLAPVCSCLCAHEFVCVCICYACVYVCVCVGLREGRAGGKRG